MKKVIFTILLVAAQAVFSQQNTTFKDQDVIISLIEDYFAHGDNKDIDGM